MRPEVPDPQPAARELEAVTAVPAAIVGHEGAPPDPVAGQPADRVAQEARRADGRLIGQVP